MDDSMRGDIYETLIIPSEPILQSAATNRQQRPKKRCTWRGVVKSVGVTLLSIGLVLVCLNLEFDLRSRATRSKRTSDENPRCQVDWKQASAQLFTYPAVRAVCMEYIESSACSESEKAAKKNEAIEKICTLTGTTFDERKRTLRAMFTKRNIYPGSTTFDFSAKPSGRTM